MNRRRFFSILSIACAAPAVVRASSLMPVHVERPALPLLGGRWPHDDTPAFQALLDGRKARHRKTGRVLQMVGGVICLPHGLYNLSNEFYETGKLTGIEGACIGTSYGDYGYCIDDLPGAAKNWAREKQLKATA